MMKTAFVALCLASVALAQSTSSIPSGTSPTCTTFLTEHNNNRVINNCLTSLIGSTSAFDSGSANGTAVNAALSTLCSSSFNSCPAAEIRSALTSFYSSCTSDLLGTNGDGSNGNSGVIAIYDNLYLILPLKDAICAKAGGQYCINSLASGSSSTPASQGGASGSSTPQGESASQTPQGDSASASASPSASASASSSSSASASASSASASAPAKRHARLDPSSLFKRSALDSHLVARQAANNTSSQQTVNAPNPTVYRESGLPYLFIQPNSTNLCSECTAQVIGAYIRFETVTPYAIGIVNSPMLRGQVDLWEQIKQCPNGFAQSLLNNATSSGGSTSSTGGAAKAVAGVGSALLAVFAAVGAAMLL